MASRHTGSELVSINSEHMLLTIKGKIPHHVDNSYSHISEVKIIGKCEATIDGNQYRSDKEMVIKTAPLFFEQTSYEIIIEIDEKINTDEIKIWHDDKEIRESISFLRSNKHLLTGQINFRNSVGYSKFDLTVGDELLSVIVEVFPTKMGYKTDFKLIVNDITNEIYNLIFDFLKKTYLMYNLGQQTNNSVVEFFAIITKIFNKMLSSVDKIISQPHHVLETTYEILPNHKIKKIDNRCLKWALKHNDNISSVDGRYNATKLKSVKKIVNYDNHDNRFVKYAILSTIKKLNQLNKNYTDDTGVVNNQINKMIILLKSRISNSFLSEITTTEESIETTLVLTMAPGYRDIYKYYIMLSKGLDVQGDVFNISIKDLAVLYEYWCFIKLNSILRKKYELVSQNYIKIINGKISVSLVKGGESTIEYQNKGDGTKITLCYNKSFSNLPTIAQKPDNTLELRKESKNGYSFHYIFDAKYRINMGIDNDYLKCYGGSGPVEDDINTMHRYRDAIVYQNREKYIHSIVGAFVLFPYDKTEEEYTKHSFFSSIDRVNIGGVPFLPNKTTLAEKIIEKLINDPEYNVKKHTILPTILSDNKAIIDSLSHYKDQTSF